LDKCIGIEENRANRPPIRNIEVTPIVIAKDDVTIVARLPADWKRL
jgi:hypothetical protein